MYVPTECNVGNTPLFPKNRQAATPALLLNFLNDSDAKHIFMAGQNLWSALIHLDEDNKSQIHPEFALATRTFFS